MEVGSFVVEGNEKVDVDVEDVRNRLGVGCASDVNDMALTCN
jgi:hypothetical protein